MLGYNMLQPTQPYGRQEIPTKNVQAVSFRNRYVPTAPFRQNIRHWNSRNQLVVFGDMAKLDLAGLALRTRCFGRFKQPDRSLKIRISDPRPLRFGRHFPRMDDAPSTEGTDEETELETQTSPGEIHGLVVPTNRHK